MLDEFPYASALLERLERDCAYAGKPEWRVVEIRRFLETLRDAMKAGIAEKLEKQTKSFEHQSGWIEGLKNVRAAFGVKEWIQEFHDGHIAALVNAFSPGNQGAHKNPSVDDSEAQLTLRSVVRAVPPLLKQLAHWGIPIDEHLALADPYPSDFKRGQTVFDALKDAHSADVEWAATWVGLVAALRESGHAGDVEARLSHWAPKERVRAVFVKELPALGLPAEDCAIRFAAQRLLGEAAFVRWDAQDISLRRELDRGVPRAPVMRIELDPTSTPDSGTILRIRLFGRQFEPLASDEEPRDYSSEGSTSLAAHILAAWSRWQRAGDPGERTKLDRGIVVVQLAVPYELADATWPLIAVDRNRKISIEGRFKDVVFDPTVGDSLYVPVDLPDHVNQRHTAFVWTEDEDEADRVLRTRPIAFAGPPTYDRRNQSESTSILAHVLLDRAAVALMPEESEHDAIRTLGLEVSKPSRTEWQRIMDRIAELRRNTRPDDPLAYRIFLMDPRYREPDAYGLY
jgi:hypothetical protein